MGFRLVALVFLNSICLSSLVESSCTKGCDLALASYYVGYGNYLSSIAQYMNTGINNILQYNLDTVFNQESLPANQRINVPFSCECINGEFLGHVFSSIISSGDTYELIAEERYANLTTVEWYQRFNSITPSRIPLNVNVTFNVTVNCSCGDNSISKSLWFVRNVSSSTRETLDSIASATNLSSELIRRYNPDANFSAVRSLIYIPGRDENGNYPPLITSSGDSALGLSGRAIGGIVVALVAGVLLLSGPVYYGFNRNKNSEKSSALLKNTKVQLMQYAQGASPVLTGIKLDKSVEFLYEELSRATDKFSDANKIGQGGFGVVYYAELRGEVWK